MPVWRRTGRPRETSRCGGFGVPRSPDRRGRARMVGPDHGTHVSVTGVVEHTEVLVAQAAHRVDDAHDLAGLVEHEARLEFPAHVQAVVGRDLARLVPDLDQPIDASLVAEL